jgi:predicted nucleotidyltransferase
MAERSYLWQRLRPKDRERRQRLQQAREAVALEAARLLYYGACKEYIEAKRVAAQKLGIGALPSNREVAIKLLEYAVLVEGDEYWRKLRRFREEALHLMMTLSSFRPRLVGSVWRGIIKPSSDIDIELDFTDPEPVKRKLLEEGYRIIEEGPIEVPEPLRYGSLWRIEVETPAGSRAEIILKEHEWYVRPPRCDIYGDPKKGLNPVELREVLEKRPDALFIPGLEGDE